MSIDTIRSVPQYDFKALGTAVKTAKMERKESRKKVSDEMFISTCYLANIENKGQHLSLQIFFELILRYNISVDQFLLNTPTGKNMQRQKDSRSQTGKMNKLRISVVIFEDCNVFLSLPFCKMAFCTVVRIKG